MEQIRSADVLANFPQVDEEKLNAALAAEAAASNRKECDALNKVFSVRRVGARAHRCLL